MRKDESRPTENDRPLRQSRGFDDREGIQGSGRKTKAASFELAAVLKTEN
jgi:hypothetical protein